MPDTPTSSDIAQRRFAVARRGFEPSEVLDFLNDIAVRMECLEQAVAAVTPEHIARMEQELRERLAAIVNEHVDEANAIATQIVEDARRSAS